MSGLLNEMARQFAVVRSGIVQRRDDPAIVEIVEHVAQQYDASFAALSIITGDRQILVSRLGTDLFETPRSASFCATAIHLPGEPLVVPDAALDPRFAGLDSVLHAPFIRFYAGMPVMDDNGYALGALCVADHRPRRRSFDASWLVTQAREIERVIRR